MNESKGESESTFLHLDLYSHLMFVPSTNLLSANRLKSFLVAAEFLLVAALYEPQTNKHVLNLRIRRRQD